MTAYEMRISDCSSDVCSSDLGMCAEIDPAAQSLVAQTQRLEKMREMCRHGPRCCWPSYFPLPGTIAMNRLVSISLALGLGVSVSAEIGRASGRERVCHYV